jgi:hypothetical protein
MKRLLPYALLLGIAGSAYAGTSDIAKLVRDNSGSNTRSDEKATRYAVQVPAPEGYSKTVLRFWDTKDEKAEDYFVLELYTAERLTVLEDKGADWTFEKEYIGNGADENAQRQAVYKGKPASSAPSAASTNAAEAVRAQLEKYLASKQ